MVDAAAAILGLATVIALGLGAAVAYAHVRGGDDESPRGNDENPGGDDANPGGNDENLGGDDQNPDQDENFLQSPLMHVAVWGAGAGLAVAGRNWRSPGFRVVGLRRVDARTGGPVSVRSVLIGLVLDLARQSATRPLFRARARRERDRRKELAPRLKEIERDQVADPEARRRAVRAFYKENDFNPFAGCGWQLAGPILSQLVLAGAIRDGRTVHDRLTGTIVVTDR